MGDSIIYKLKSGKPNKFLNFLSGFAGLAIPDAFSGSGYKDFLPKRPNIPITTIFANAWTITSKRTNHSTSQTQTGSLVNVVGFIIPDELGTIPVKCSIQLTFSTNTT